MMSVALYVACLAFALMYPLLKLNQDFNIDYLNHLYGSLYLQLHHFQ